MATYRGTDGKADYGAAHVTIAQCRSWSIDDALGVIPINYKGIKHQQVKGGITSGTAQVVCDFDKATGVEDLVDLIATATPAGTPQELRLYIDADQYLTVSALFSHFNLTSPEGDAVAAITLDFVLSGAIDVTNL